MQASECDPAVPPMHQLLEISELSQQIFRRNTLSIWIDRPLGGGRTTVDFQLIRVLAR
jgi:hypothetical protein